MEKKSIQQWINKGRRNCLSFVFYQNHVIDVSAFMLDHPGGVKAIKNYIYKDITNIIFEVYPHPRNHTLNMLMKFKVGQIPIDEAQTAKMKSTQKHKSKKKVCFDNHDNVQQDKVFESVNKKSVKSSKKSTSKSKSKKKQNVTSIKVLNLPEKQQKQNKQKENNNKIQQNSITKKVTSLQTKKSSSFLQNQLDEQKPNFKIPIFNTKSNNKFSH